MHGSIDGDNFVYLNKILQLEFHHSEWQLFCGSCTGQVMDLSISYSIWGKTNIFITILFGLNFCNWVNQKMKIGEMGKQDSYNFPSKTSY